MSATTRTTRQGFTFSRKMAQYLDAVNTLLQLVEGETSDMRILQGSWSYADTSAGTHAGDAAADLSDYNGAKREKWLRKLGGAANRRKATSKWNPHIHVILDGVPTASPAALDQVEDYHDRRNGLADNGPDTGYHMYVFPKFMYGTTRARWICVVPCHAYRQPTSRDETVLPVEYHTGQATTSNDVCRVRVGETEWIVTKAGHFLKRSNFVRRPTGYVQKSEPWIVTADEAYGRVSPGIDADKIGEPLLRGKEFTSVGYVLRTVNGVQVKYVMTAGGRWITGTSLATPTTTA